MEFRCRRISGSTLSATSEFSRRLSLARIFWVRIAPSRIRVEGILLRRVSSPTTSAANSVCCGSKAPAPISRPSRTRASQRSVSTRSSRCVSATLWTTLQWSTISSAARSLRTNRGRRSKPCFTPSSRPRTSTTPTRTRSSPSLPLLVGANLRRRHSGRRRSGWTTSGPASKCLGMWRTSWTGIRTRELCSWRNTGW